MPLHHFTHTGFYAGVPFCDVDTATARERGDTFGHVPYTNPERRLNAEDTCPDCLTVWNEAAS